MRTFVQDWLHWQEPARAGRGAKAGPGGPKVHKPPRRSSPGRLLTKHGAEAEGSTPPKPDRGPSQMPTTQPAPAARNERRLVFTSSQAALYLGVSLATIRRWTDAGHIDC